MREKLQNESGNKNTSNLSFQRKLESSCLVTRHFSGRSMVEMLSVLAVIGILSAVALFGYNWAMTYYRANETIHDVMIRGTNVPMIWEDYDGYLDPHEFEFAELGKNVQDFEQAWVPSAHKGRT